MCRFVAYKGRELFLADLLTRPEHSLIKQSYDARERSEPLNGDGFGVGWYAPEIDPLPCVFTSVSPAWSNRNLYHLAEKIRSPCIFAHVRAASPGMLVSEINCHPFRFGRFLWMHNGGIPQFHKIKRRLRAWLRDEVYDFIQGTTDSEHAFAVFLNRLPDLLGHSSPRLLAHTMGATIRRLNAWCEEAGVVGAGYYNFAVTDGDCIVATRYVSDPDREPASLHFSQGVKYECQQGVCRMVQAEEHEQAVIIASEPLTAVKQEWQLVPRNHLLIVTDELKVELQPIED